MSRVPFFIRNTAQVAYDGAVDSANAGYNTTIYGEQGSPATCWPGRAATRGFIVRVRSLNHSSECYWALMTGDCPEQ